MEPIKEEPEEEEKEEMEDSRQVNLAKLFFQTWSSLPQHVTKRPSSLSVYKLKIPQVA